MSDPSNDKPLDLSVYFGVMSRDELERLVIELLVRDESVFDIIEKVCMPNASEWSGSAPPPCSMPRGHLGHPLTYEAAGPI